jgi:hypothetical protein
MSDENGDYKLLWWKGREGGREGRREGSSQLLSRGLGDPGEDHDFYGDGPEGG